MPNVAVSDHFVRRVLGPLLIVLFIVMALPPTLIVYVLFDTGAFTGVEGPTTKTIVRFFGFSEGVPESIAGPVVRVLPALVAAICLGQDRVTLTRIGRGIFLIVIYTIVVSFIALILVQPELGEQVQNVTGGRDTLVHFEDAAAYSLNNGLVYFGLLTGFAISVADAQAPEQPAPQPADADDQPQQGRAAQPPPQPQQ